MVILVGSIVIAAIDDFLGLWYVSYKMLKSWVMVALSLKMASLQFMIGSK